MSPVSDKLVTETVEKAVKATPVIVTTITETVPDLSAEAMELVANNPFRGRGLLLTVGAGAVLAGAVGFYVWRKRKNAAEAEVEENEVIVETVKAEENPNPKPKQRAS